MRWLRVVLVTSILTALASAEVPLVDHWKEGTQRIDDHLRRKGREAARSAKPSVPSEAVAQLSDDDLMLGEGAQASNEESDAPSIADASSSEAALSVGSDDGSLGLSSAPRRSSALQPKRLGKGVNVQQPTSSSSNLRRATGQQRSGSNGVEEDAMPFPLRRPPPTSMPRSLPSDVRRRRAPDTEAKTQQQQEDEMEAQLIRRMAPQRADKTKARMRPATLVDRGVMGEATRLAQRQDSTTLSAMLKAKALFAAFVADTKAQEAKAPTAGSPDKELVQVDCPKQLAGKCNLTFRDVDRH